MGPHPPCGPSSASPWPRGGRSGLNLRGGSVDSLRSVMSGLLDGRCLCGRLTYRCDGEPLVTVVCHCKDCQRQTGSAFSIFVVVPRATLHVGGDTLATYVTVGADSGEERQRQFCSKCGSPVVTLLAEQPELAVIKAGTLNDPSWLSPTLEVWCGSAQPWLAPIENSQAARPRPAGLTGQLLSSTAPSCESLCRPLVERARPTTRKSPTTGVDLLLCVTFHATDHSRCTAGHRTATAPAPTRPTAMP